MNKRRNYTIIILVCFLLFSNIYTLGLLIKSNNSTNMYLQHAFESNISSISYTMMDLNDKFFSSQDQEEQLKILDSKSKTLFSIGRRMHNLSFIDVDYYTYQTRHLARYIDFLSEKKNISKSDISTLKQLINLSTQLENVKLFNTKKGIFYNKKYPSNDVKNLLDQIYDIVKKEASFKE
ncbi:hypothetical protein R9X47_15635 [Wukongibacter baidiensis]|uniref:hypothetical protein n=1 Tax=Wukongibacter baidiensis TaxID=1723361 RepID=UPI003D7F49CE